MSEAVSGTQSGQPSTPVLSAEWSYVQSAELVDCLKARDDSWDQLGHLALLVISALESQTADRELESIEERARHAHRSVLRRGA